MSSTRRKLAATAGGLGATALAAAVASPSVRAELRRVRDFSRPLEAESGAPLPPPLPPGGIVAVDGVGELFVRDSGGPGPAVLLLHGWGATADVNFFAVYPALTDAYRVIALDHRGHGRGLRTHAEFSLEDCADDAAALLSHLGIERAVVVGYSMGGPVALLLAHRRPGLCIGLVLEATSLEFQEGARERALWRSLNVFEAGLRLGSGDGVVQRLIRAAVDAAPEVAEYRPWLAAEFRRGDIRSIVEAGRALSAYDARPFAASLGLPAVAVVTTRDRLVSPRKQRMMAAALGAEVIELRGDHDVPVSDGAALGAATRTAVEHVSNREPSTGRRRPRRTGEAAGA